MNFGNCICLCIRARTLRFDIFCTDCVRVYFDPSHLTEFRYRRRDLVRDRVVFFLGFLFDIHIKIIFQVDSTIDLCTKSETFTDFNVARSKYFARVYRLFHRPCAPFVYFDPPDRWIVPEHYVILYLYRLRAIRGTGFRRFTTLSSTTDEGLSLTLLFYIELSMGAISPV